MKGLSRMLLLVPMVLAMVPPLPGEEPAPQKIVELERRLEEQSAQLRLLTREVTRLADLLEGQGRRSSAAQAGPEPAPPAAIPVAQAAATPEPPSAEVVAAQTPLHQVVKGETLTSISRQHGIALEDLIRLNGISDGRKLQIGQTLRLPSPATDAQPSPETR